MASTKVTVGSSSTQLVAADDSSLSRDMVVLVNDSDEDIYISLGGTAVLNEGIRLNAGGGAFELNTTNMFRGVINGICASGGKNISIEQT